LVFEGSPSEVGWKFQLLAEGQKLCQPQPLFSKLDEDVVEQESERLGSTSDW